MRKVTFKYYHNTNKNAKKKGTTGTTLSSYTYIIAFAVTESQSRWADFAKNSGCMWLLLYNSTEKQFPEQRNDS